MRPPARLRRAVVALTATAALVTAGALPATASASTAPAAPVFAATSAQSPEQQAAAVINLHRTRAGLPALKVYGSLSGPAERWAAYLARTGTFAHSTGAWRTTTTGLYGWGVTGENLAAGYVTGKSAVNAWMVSPGHKANILNRSYTGVGLGYVNGGPYGHYWVAIFGVADPPIPKGIIPKLSGSTQVGQEIYLRTAKWPAGTTFRYQWYSEGRAIPGATAARYVVTGNEVGTRLRVKLMAYHRDYFPVSVMSKFSSVAHPPS